MRLSTRRFIKCVDRSILSEEQVKRCPTIVAAVRDMLNNCVASEDIARKLGMNIDELQSLYRVLIDQDDAIKAARLRKALWKLVDLGDAQTAKWMSKQVLGMREPKQEIEATINVYDEAAEKIREANERAQRLRKDGRVLEAVK